MHLISRRTLLTASLFAGPPLFSMTAVANDPNGELQKRIAALEAKYGGRLGVAILDTAKSNAFAYRGDERFALCSTYKCLAAAFVLARVDGKAESLSRHVTYYRSDLVTYSPVAGKYVDAGMTIGELCEAAVTLSDNTAGNLLFDSFGGPTALTGYLRSIGDNETRLDRYETALNENAPGDPRDTTTRLAMATTIERLVRGTALSKTSREQLAAWLIACKTGDKRLRAGVPKDWRIGDKTGGGAHNATNDVAVMWPPGRAPTVVTVYYTNSEAPDDQRNAILSEVGRLATSA
jgi:beta-lactamase class A